MKYDVYLEELEKHSDSKHKDFQSKLLMNDKLIGVRTPVLKRIAKSIARSNYQEFFKENKHELYEDNLVHGLILGYLKLEYNSLKPYIEKFLPFIDNYVVCDITVSNLKIYKKNKIKDMVFCDATGYINDSNYWINRFGYMILLNYFIEEKYIDKILELCQNYKDEYYVKTAIVELILSCYMKYKGRTLTFLKQCNLDDWTYNKSIQKIIGSNKLTEKDKKLLKGMKRK